MNKREQERQEAITELRGMIKPGDTIYTVLRHVSKSGMSRGIDVFIMQDNAPRWITAYVGKAIGSPQTMKDWQSSRGLRVNGCGMDMGFHLVESLSYSIYGEYKCLGKGKCPSSYHTNYKRRIRCDGAGNSMCWQYEEFKVTRDIAGTPLEYSPYAIKQGDGFIVCPTCNGEGYNDNPAGRERYNLTHKDGYALHHKWI